MFVEPQPQQQQLLRQQGLAPAGTETHPNATDLQPSQQASLQQASYYSTSLMSTSPRARQSPRPAGIAVRSLRRSISGGGGGYDVCSPDGAVIVDEDGNAAVVAPEADDFAHEILAMNTLAMQRCRAEELDEALHILNEAFMRIADCEQNGGQVAGSGAEGEYGSSHTPQQVAGAEEGCVVEPQLLEQLKATTLNNMGVVECHRGQPRQALSHFEGARQLEESWNMCSPSVALNTCAAYNALNMYDKATAAALETIDMLRTLEIQRKLHEKRRKRLLEAEQQQQQLHEGAGGEGVSATQARSPSRTRRSLAVAAASTATRADQAARDEELAALIAAGQPQIADSDNSALWGAAWHNLAVAQVNTARQAARKNDVTSEFTNTLRIFQNAMRATQELLGAQHPMTEAVTQTYRSVRAAMREKGTFMQHRTLMTAPPIAVDPREREMAELTVTPAAGLTRHATLERQRKDLTITFRGAVTRGEKLMERIDAAAYPGAAEEAYQRSRRSAARDTTPGANGRGKTGGSKKKKSVGPDARGCSSLRSMPLSATLAQASEVYGNPHPLLYSGVGAGDAAAREAGREPDGVSWVPSTAAGAAGGGARAAAYSHGRTFAASDGNGITADEGAPAASRARQAPRRAVSPAKGGGSLAATAPSRSAAQHHLPHLTGPHRSSATSCPPQRLSTTTTTITTTVVDQSKLLLLAHPPPRATTASAKTTYYPIDVPVPPPEPNAGAQGAVPAQQSRDGFANSANAPPEEGEEGQERGPSDLASRGASLPRGADVIWKSPDSATRATHAQPGSQTPTPPATQSFREPTRPQPQQAAKRPSLSSSSSRRTETPSLSLDNSQRQHRGARPGSTGGRSAGNRHVPASDAGRLGPQAEDRLTPRGSDRAKDATSPSPSTATPTRPRELFDAVWVTADTQYVRYGNAILARSEYSAMMRSGAGTSTRGSAITTTTSPPTTTTVMSVDAEGGLVAITNKSPTLFPVRDRLEELRNTHNSSDEQLESPSTSTIHNVTSHRPPSNVYHSDAEAGTAAVDATATVGDGREGSAALPTLRGDMMAVVTGEGAFVERPSARGEAALTPIAVYSDSSASEVGDDAVNVEEKDEDGDGEEDANRPKSCASTIGNSDTEL